MVGQGEGGRPPGRRTPAPAPRRGARPMASLAVSRQLEMGSTCLWRVVCNVPPQTFLGLTEPPNGEGGVGGRYQRRDAVGSTRDACAPHLQLNCYGLPGNGLVLPAPARFWHPGCKHLWLAYPLVVSPAASSLVRSTTEDRPKRPPATGCQPCRVGLATRKDWEDLTPARAGTH